MEDGLGSRADGASSARASSARPPEATSPPVRAGPARSAELFGERDDDPIGAAEVAEPIEILVLRHHAHELGAVGPHAGLEVVDDDADMVHPLDRHVADPRAARATLSAG